MFVPRVQDIHLPVAPANQAAPPLSETIKKIALVCLKELAVSIALSGAVACFVPVATGLSFMMGACLVQFVVSVFFHALGAHAANQLKQQGPNSKYEKIVNICEWMTGANFAIFTGFNAQTLIHESGHTLAALAIYKRPRPQIEIYPFIGGVTQFYKSSMTGFGKKLGPVAATCLIVASGPAFTLLISGVLLAIGIAMKDRYPAFGKYLISWGVLDFLNHAHYAYSALHADQSIISHDFVHLSIFGLHPIVATIAILAMPVLIMAGMQWIQNRTQRPVLAHA